MKIFYLPYTQEIGKLIKAFSKLAWRDAKLDKGESDATHYENGFGSVGVGVGPFGRIGGL
jgi:hypothetical protein